MADTKKEKRFDVPWMGKYSQSVSSSFQSRMLRFKPSSDEGKALIQEMSSSETNPNFWQILSEAFKESMNLPASTERTAILRTWIFSINRRKGNRGSGFPLWETLKAIGSPYHDMASSLLPAFCEIGAKISKKMYDQVGCDAILGMIERKDQVGVENILSMSSINPWQAISRLTNDRNLSDKQQKDVIEFLNSKETLEIQKEDLNDLIHDFLDGRNKLLAAHLMNNTLSQDELKSWCSDLERQGRLEDALLIVPMSRAKLGFG